jgi:hypothetical protein
MWTASGTLLMSDVGPAVIAATTMITMPATIATAVAVPDSKPNRNGAAMNSAPARYSMRPCTARGRGPWRIMRRSYPRRAPCGFEPQVGPQSAGPFEGPMAAPQRGTYATRPHEGSGASSTGCPLRSGWT